MTKKQFDAALTTAYPTLRLTVISRYGEEDGQDVFHDALVALYRSKAYVRFKGGPRKLQRWLTEAVVFAVRERRRNAAKDNARYILLSTIEQRMVQHAVADEFGDTSHVLDLFACTEPTVEIQHDVRTALGTLCWDDQQVAYAHFFDGATLREIASRTSRTFYAVFSQVEIIKACLKTALAAYAPLGKPARNLR